MFAHDTTLEEALRFSRFDRNHMLATSEREIILEEHTWASAEHYLHSMLAGNHELAVKTRDAETALVAYKLNKPWYRSKKRGWKNLRRVYMTRALYTLVQMYPQVKQFLLDTGEQLIIESSLYDHYWGIGRDQRGENMTGRVWMDIRTKLRKDSGRDPGDSE